MVRQNPNPDSREEYDESIISETGLRLGMEISRITILLVRENMKRRLTCDSDLDVIGSVFGSVENVKGG